VLGVASSSGQEGSKSALFVRTRSSGRYWFNTALKKTEEVRQQYRWAGWLMGQCFANRCMLCLPLPEVLFEKLLKGSSFQVGKMPAFLHLEAVCDATRGIKPVHVFTCTAA
jgi:hypothetical protein